MTDMAWLNDTDDTRVQAALNETCPICKAKPGDWCRNTLQPQPLPGRLLHHGRSER